MERNIEVEKYEFYGEKILTDEIREITNLIHNANLHNYYKFIVIHNIDQISQNSMNILLKTIEEPNSSVIFFFTTDNIYNTLSTIKSRCFHININHLEKIYCNINGIKYENINTLKEKNDEKIDIKFFIKKDKNTKEEEKIIDKYLKKEFYEKIKSTRKPNMRNLIKEYECQIEKIEKFNCNKKAFFNKMIFRTMN